MAQLPQTASSIAAAVPAHILQETVRKLPAVFPTGGEEHNI